MKKSKVSIIQISRILVQVLFFILLPALYINTFAGIKQIYIAIVQQNFSFSMLLPQIIEVLVIIPVTALMGRFFCGWMCAFGAFGDLIYSISKRVFKIKFKINKDVDKAMKYIKYLLLAFLIFYVCTFNISEFSGFSPWDAFGMLATVGQIPDFSYVALNLTVGFILFLLITLASMFIERFFCRYLCPLGAVFAMTSKFRIFKIKKTRTNCGNCRACTNQCPMGIELYKTDVVDSGECINCMKCITVCPRKNATMTVSGDDVRPLIAGAAAVAVITGLYYAGNFGVKAAGLSDEMSAEAQAQVQAGIISPGSFYLDGTYEGTGIGFRNRRTTVSVVVKNGKITDIESISYGDDRKFYVRAFNMVTQEIIAGQTTDVDAVSGATFSSVGIMEAVENALSNAKLSMGITNSNTVNSSSNATTSTEQFGNQYNNNGSNNETAGSNEISASNQPAASSTNNASAGANTSSSPGGNTATNSGTQYKDGTYLGSGIGFRNRTTTVSVVVKNGQVTDITTVSSGDDRKFYNRAFNMVTQAIKSSQSTDVDAVSGATYSSRGIMDAVRNALSKAM